MSKSEVGAVYLKTVAQSSTMSHSEVGAVYLKTVAQSSAMSHSEVGAVYLKVLGQYPQPYKDGGDLRKLPHTRLTNSYTKSN